MKTYAHPVLSKALIQLVNTIVPLVFAVYLMKRSLVLPYWVTVLLAIPTAGLLIRTFIIQHDCGHGSFFASRRWNDVVGTILGMVTLMPYRFWLKEHAAHHATSGNLDQRGRGDILTLTVREYLEKDFMGRMQYRIYRNPVVLFLVGAPLYFLFVHRYPWFIPRSRRDSWRSVYLSNIGLGLLVFLGCVGLGTATFFEIYVPVVYFASVAGAWFFFVQHQFEGVRWVRSGQWDFKRAALESSSLYDLPPVLRWFSGNIGFHHIHHLESRIPNYRLRECYQALPEMQNINRITLWNSLRCMQFALWDEDTGELIPFRALRRALNNELQTGS